MTSEYFEFNDALLSTDETRMRADARLYFSNEGGLDIETVGSKFDFRTIENEIAGLDFLGEGRLKGVVKGPYDAIKIYGHAHMKNFRFEKK